MRFLLYEQNFHDKNRKFIERMVRILGWEFGIGKNIDNYDVIYSPCDSIDTSSYKDKKFIFGPHFSVYPDHKMDKITYTNNGTSHDNASSIANP